MRLKIESMKITETECICEECGHDFDYAGCRGYAIQTLNGEAIRLCNNCFRAMSKEELLDLVGVPYADGYGCEVEKIANEWELEKKRKERVFATPRLIHETL